MHNFQRSLFYDLQVFLQASDFHRKYYTLFQALDLSPLPDRNNGAGRDGFSRHAMLRALIHRALLGRFFLRIVYWLEERAPFIFGRIGQYPMLLFQTPSNPNLNRSEPS